MMNITRKPNTWIWPWTCMSAGVPADSGQPKAKPRSKYSPRQDTITGALVRETNATGDWAVLRVQDHGVGIPRGEMRQVFDRFYRGSNVPREIRGVGIGLAGVRDIVEQHGGEISVESAEGIGTTFTVHLPLQSVERDRHANPTRVGGATPTPQGLSAR